MFHKVTAAATLAGMFLHAMLGCCCHDACLIESYTAADSEAVAAEASPHPKCRCHAHQSKSTSTASLTGADESDRHQHHHGLCEETHCRFVRTADASAELQLLQSSVALISVDAAILPVDIGQQPKSKPGNTLIDTSPPARLRAHVWLL